MLNEDDLDEDDYTETKRPVWFEQLRDYTKMWSRLMDDLNEAKRQGRIRECKRILANMEDCLYKDLREQIKYPETDDDIEWIRLMRKQIVDILAENQFFAVTKSYQEGDAGFD